VRRPRERVKCLPIRRFLMARRRRSAVVKAMDCRRNFRQCVVKDREVLSSTLSTL
jgi:hypothetical protein